MRASGHSFMPGQPAGRGPFGLVERRQFRRVLRAAAFVVGVSLIWICSPLAEAGPPRNLLRLIDAIQQHDAEAVEYLLNSSVPVNVTFPDNNALLQMAITARAISVIQLLLDRGADIEAQSSDGWTPLMLAIAQGDRLVVSLLLDRGAKVNSLILNGSSPRSVALETGNTEILDLIIGAKEFAPRAIGLLQAIYGNDHAMVRLLLSEGAKPDQADADGLTPMMHAAYADATEAIALLSESGARIDRVTNEGVTALMVAALHGKVQAVKALLDVGADPDHQARDGATARRFAENNGHSEIASLLEGREKKVSAQVPAHMFKAAIEGNVDHYASQFA